MSHFQRLIVLTLRNKIGVKSSFSSPIGIALAVLLWVILPSPPEPVGVGSEEIAGRLLDTYEKGEQGYPNRIKALTSAVEALSQKQGEPDAPPGIPEALAQLKQGDPKAAETVFKEMVKRAEPNIKAMAKALRHLGALASLHNSDKALSAYRRSVAFDPDQADGWNELAHLFQRVGQLGDAVSAYQNVLRVGEEAKEESVIAVAYGNLGTVYRARGELDQAEKTHRKALDLNEALGRKIGMASDYGNLGIVYKTRGELDQAEKMYRKALTIFQAAGAAPQVAQVEKLLKTLRTPNLDQ